MCSYVIFASYKVHSLEEPVLKSQLFIDWNREVITPLACEQRPAGFEGRGVIDLKQHSDESFVVLLSRYYDGNYLL